MARHLIDQNPAREQRRQSMLLDRLTLTFRKPLAEEIARAMREMADAFEHTSEVMPAQGHFDKLTGIFQTMAIVSGLTFSARIIDQGKAAGYQIETKEEFASTMTRLALQYVQRESIRRKITSISETTRADVIAIVDQGYRDGLGAREIARGIRDVLPVRSLIRGELIARTETHGAANYGAMVAASETGLPLSKQWVAGSDHRTRPDHADANGQRRGMDKPFNVGGAALMFPGDPDGPPEQVIQCRCAVAYIVQDD